MISIESKSELASQLSIKKIEELSDEEIVSLSSERPGRPGQYGYLLDKRHFKSSKHLSEISMALMKRLMLIENLDELVARTNSSTRE